MHDSPVKNGKNFKVDFLLFYWLWGLFLHFELFTRVYRIANFFSNVFWDKRKVFIFFKIPPPIQHLGFHANNIVHVFPIKNGKNFKVDFLLFYWLWGLFLHFELFTRVYRIANFFSKVFGDKRKVFIFFKISPPI